MCEKILKFIEKNELLSWAMCDEIGVYTASAFYAFDKQNLALLIASHKNTKHIKLATLNPEIAVNIAPPPTSLLSLQGLQAKAKFTLADDLQSKIYYKKFPFAKLGNAQIYALNLHYAKLTNNALSKKIEFQR